MEVKLIQDLRSGEKVVCFFILRKKELKVKKDTNEPFLSLELGDRSGRIKGSLWEKAEEVYNLLTVGDIVKVKGSVIDYEDSLYLSIDKIRKAVAEDKVDQSYFLPTTTSDRQMLYLYLLSIIDSLKNVHLKQLLHCFFDDVEFKKKFTEAPAAKLWHHAYLGGLLEHTIGVADICDKVLGHYELVNRDLLLAGALLHDIGKIVELSTKGFIDYSDEGRLLGHIAIGCQMVTEKIMQLKDFPESMTKELLHLILSHHGQLEQGSPVVPMTLEAIILYHVDELDSKANAFLRIIKKEKEYGKKWSKYVNLIDRFIYLGQD